MNALTSAFWKPVSIALAMLALAVLPAHAVVGVTVNLNLPIITNDFSGKVSVTISGLSAGKTVLVERFADLNGNGIIEVAQEPVVTSFTLTDGQLPLIGGVRNLNLPGDDDGSANGSIRADLNFPGVDLIFGLAVGKYVFRVSDPLSGFSSVTAPFEIKQKPQAQGVSGKITAVTGGAALAGAFIAMAPPNGQPVAAAYTDASGNYSFQAPAGSYGLYIVKTNFVSDFNNTFLTITAGQTATKNVALAGAAYVISGKVSNSSGGAGIPGIFVSAESTNDLFAGGVTDTNGNYSFSVTASQWKIRPQDEQLAQYGFLSIQDRIKTNTTASGSSVLNFSLPKANALIYGTVKDNATLPVLGLSMQAMDQGSLYKAVGVTFSPNGDFAVAVLGGTWAIGPDSDALLARGYTGGSGVDVTVGVGQAVVTNLVVQGVTAHLRGQIQDGNGQPIPNIEIVVQPVPFVQSGAGSVYPTTDGNGIFDAGVRAGVWDIQLECVSAQSRGFVLVSGHQYTVVDGTDQNNLVLSYPAFTATINGTVKDSQNHPIMGVTVDASQSIDQNHGYVPGCISTDANGSYSIRVLGGTWQVKVRSDELTARGYSGVADQNPTISGGTATANFVALPLPPMLNTPAYSGSQVQFDVSTPAPITYGYTVQYCTTLKSADWVTLLTTNTTTGGFHFVDPSANGTFRFYRVTSP